MIRRGFGRGLSNTSSIKNNGQNSIKPRMISDEYKRAGPGPEDCIDEEYGCFHRRRWYIFTVMIDQVIIALLNLFDELMIKVHYFGDTNSLYVQTSKD